MTEFEFIEAEKANFSVSGMCRVLGASRSGFYEWRGRGPSERRRRRDALARKVLQAHEASRRTYGSPRVREALLQQGEVVSKKTVASVMQEIGLVARPRRAFRVTTDSRFTERLAPNLVDRNFVATKPNEVWVTDVTALPVLGGWVFLASIIDLYARRVVGWAAGATLDQTLTGQALERALVVRRPVPGLVHHSDQGSHYTGAHYQALLTRSQCVVSYSRRGDCWDNAVVESFFATLKTELVRDVTWRTRDQARAELGAYLDGWYNYERRHSSLGYLSPVAYERQHLVA